MISQKFKTEYARLNTKQREAVDTIEGPVMVIAGPGTGKTTILTLRIANILIKTDTPPSGILALTFTEAGAKTMRSKLKEIIGERAFEVPIHTFHGFAASIIAEFSDHFPHLSRSKQITDIEAEKLVRQILKQNKFNKLRPLGEPDFYVSKIIRTISESKQEAWTPEMLKSFAEEEIERVKQDPDSISSRGESKGKLKGDALKRIEKCERTILFAGAYEDYEALKIKERKMDFDDLIFELLKALRQDKLLLQILQEKFLYILLDEHQDTNDSQNMMVRTLATFFESPNLFVVGDEKQAIYRFQGASVENFLGFQKIWSDMKVIALSDNYRSHQGILDASFKMIEQNYGENEHLNLRIKLKSENGQKTEQIDLVEAPDTQTEESYIVKKLKAIREEEPEKKVAIIVRRNSDVAKMISLLEDNDIAASAERGANIFSHPVGALFFSLLEFLADPSKTEALAETFAGGLWEADFAKRAGFIKMARSGDVEEIFKKITTIPKLIKEINLLGITQYLVLAADLSGFEAIVARDPLGAEVWRAIFSLAQSIAQTNGIESARELIEELMDYKKSAEQRTIKIKTGKSDASITIMTAHGSKGLEFDYVFLPYAVEETWINKNRGSFFVMPKEKEEGDNIRDERRLFYVSLTRAKKHVSISFSAEDETGKILTPLRFLDELDSAHVSKTILKKEEAKRTSQSIEKLESKRAREQIEYAKMVLLENGLSVTALNHFLNCPSEFFYKSILKLPEPQSPSSEKGNAMHEAIANVWKAGKNLNAPQITDIITSSVQNYFKHSLLPKFEKEAVLEELITNAPKVAAALTDHFNQGGSVSAEKWVEAPFEYKFNKENISINLHGRLDAIVESQKNILVYDYKTREAMSVGAIKGETKSSERTGGGNYFRQLVFYKMLLQDSPHFAGKTIEPALVFVKPDSKGRCPTISLPIEKNDMEKVKKEIDSLIESVWSGTILNSTCSDKLCQYCGLRKLALQN